MSKIVTLALLLAKSLYREKASYLFAVMAVTIMLLSLGLSGTQIGVKHKLFEDILLTSQGYFLILAALFYAFAQRSREQSLGIFVLPLANGMKRYEYLLAQMVSLAWLIFILFFMFFVLDAGLIYLIEGSVYLPVLWQLFLYCLAAILVAFLVVTLSQYVSLTNAMLYAIAFFLMGHALDEVFIYSASITDSLMLQKLAIFYYLLPNFSLYDIQGAVVNRRSVDWWSEGVVPLLYYVVWSALLFLFSLLKFRKKALTVGN